MNLNLAGCLFLDFKHIIFSVFIISSVILFLSDGPVYNNINAFVTPNHNGQVILASTDDVPCPEQLPDGTTFMDENGCVQSCSNNTLLMIPNECFQTTQDNGQQQPTQDNGQQQPTQGNLLLNNSASLVTKTYGPETIWDHGWNDSEYRPSSECQKDLTGRWVANDGGKYYLRQFNGDQLWWLGSNSFKPGEGFANVFSGTRHDHYGKSLWGDWQDVPLGSTTGSGRLDFYITESGTKMHKTSSSGDAFGASEWTRMDNNCMGVLPGSSTGTGGGFIQMFPTPPK